MIVRTKRSSHYTVINNTVINDENLDWKELGLLVYLLSKPDAWQVSASHLAKNRKTKRDGVYSILKRLCLLGYASRKPNPKGGWDWLIYENPNTENPNTDKTTQVITERAVKTERAVITEKELLSSSENKKKENVCEEAIKDEVVAIEPKQPSKQKLEIIEVFEFWQKTLNHPKAKLDSKRQKVIASAIRAGYSVDDLKTSIIGCSKTPHNMGVNDRNEIYDKVSVIFKDGEQIERFINNATIQPKQRQQNQPHQPSPRGPSEDEWNSTDW